MLTLLLCINRSHLQALIEYLFCIHFFSLLLLFFNVTSSHENLFMKWMYRKITYNINRNITSFHFNTNVTTIYIQLIFIV
jgi:hypothetical protein